MSLLTHMPNVVERSAAQQVGTHHLRNQSKRQDYNSVVTFTEEMAQNVFFSRRRWY